MSGKKDIITREISETEKQILLEKYKTAMKKAQFVNEIKNGLGAEIKLNPNKIKIIKKPWYKKLFNWFKKIFTTF